MNMQGIGFSVMLIGLQISIVVENIIIVLLSLLTGAIIGKFFQLEKGLDGLGKWLSINYVILNNSRISQVLLLLR